MEQEEFGRTNGLIREGEIASEEPSPAIIEEDFEQIEVLRLPNFRRPSQPPPILCRTWVLFVSFFIGIATGSIYSWSVLMDDMLEAFPTWNRTSVPHTVSFVFVGYGITQFFFGLWKQLRAMAILASLLTASGYLLCWTGLEKDLQYLFYFGGLINGVGLGYARLAFVGFVESWFEFDPGLVSSWVGTVSALGGAAFAWGFRYYIDSVALSKSTYVALKQSFFWAAIVVGGSQLWASFFMQINDPKEILGETPYKPPMKLKEMLRTSQFWQILIVYFTNLTPMIGVLSVFSSRIRHYGNITKVMAATYLSMLCIVSAASRMCVRVTARAVGPKFLAGCLNLGGAATFIIITYSLDSNSAPIMTLIWLILANACFASSFGLTEELCVKIFGRGSGPSVYWRVSMAIPMAGIVGPSVISIKPDHFFKQYCYGSSALLLLGLVVLCTIRKVVPKRGYGSLV